MNSAHGYTEGADVPQQPQAEKTDNELIAEFVGCSKPSNPDFDYFWNGEFFKEYRAKWTTSWDWLMPVVEKIEAMKEVSFDIHREATLIRVYQDRSGAMIKKIRSPDANSKITHVYRAVVEFIKWFNAQPK